MGWYYTNGASKSDIIAELNRTHESETAKYETLASCVRGNVLWQLRQTTNKTTGEEMRYIGCNILGGDPDGWGYKDMDETCGPYYNNCPLSYLERCTEPVNDYSRQFRDRVRAYHNRLKEIGDLKPGAEIQFKNPLSFGFYVGEQSAFKVKDARRRRFYTMPTGYEVTIRKETLMNGEWEVIG
jgi:hypothetical protein